jgi:SnoaL-like domain
MTSADDRLDVIETCNRFGWHADQRQWDESRWLLADMVHVDYTRLSGGEPDTIARADLVASWAEQFARLTTTQHMITNHRVTMQGDSAICTADLRALHIAPTPDGAQEVVIYGHYRFGLARTSEGWRIDSIVMTPIWTTGDLTLLDAESTPIR